MTDSTIEPLVALRLLSAALLLRRFSGSELAQTAHVDVEVVERWLQSTTVLTPGESVKGASLAESLWQVPMNARLPLREMIRQTLTEIREVREPHELPQAPPHSLEVAESYAEDAEFADTDERQAYYARSATEWLTTARAAIGLYGSTSACGGSDIQHRFRLIENRLRKQRIGAAIRDWEAERFERWFLSPCDGASPQPATYRVDAFDRTGHPNPHRRQYTLIPPIPPEARSQAIHGLLSAISQAHCGMSTGPAVERRLLALTGQIQEEMIKAEIDSLVSRTELPTSDIYQLSKILKILLGFSIQSEDRWRQNNLNQKQRFTDNPPDAFDWIDRLRQNKSKWQPAFSLIYLWMFQKSTNRFSLKLAVEHDLQSVDDLFSHVANQSNDVVDRLLLHGENWRRAFRSDPKQSVRASLNQLENMMGAP